MNTLNTCIQEVHTARQQFLQEVSNLTNAQANFKPAPDAWSICEITEHLVWAEQIGVNRMWQAVNGKKTKQPVWEGEALHHGLSIETIISKTWQPKEQVPEVAEPRWGGPIDFWINSLKGCQAILEKLAVELEGLDPAQIIYPHPISGPLNIWQRIDFLRFHIERHLQQVKRVKAAVGYDG